MKEELIRKLGLNNSNGLSISVNQTPLVGTPFQHSPYVEKFVREDTYFGVYAGRCYPVTLADSSEGYQALRTKAVLYDVPEKPLEIYGPDATDFLHKVFTRRADDLKIGRSRYLLALNEAGGILMDGILFRLGEQRFWFVQADGMFEPWLEAHAIGLEVTVRDPQSWVLQVQGPNSYKVMQAATAGQLPDTMGYFHADYFDIGGETFLVSRTGFTGEFGYEIYCNGPETDHHALWDHLMQCGREFGLYWDTLNSMNTRRIEAGILNNGSDINPQINPFQAGLGNFVDMNMESFIGRKALANADKGLLLYGLVCDGLTPEFGQKVFSNGKEVGQLGGAVMSPELGKGIGYVRFVESADWENADLELFDESGSSYVCKVGPLPFFDKEKKIPKGLT